MRPKGQAPNRNATVSNQNKKKNTSNKQKINTTDSQRISAQEQSAESISMENFNQSNQAKNDHVEKTPHPNMFSILHDQFEDDVDNQPLSNRLDFLAGHQPAANPITECDTSDDDTSENNNQQIQYAEPTNQEITHSTDSETEYDQPHHNILQTTRNNIHSEQEIHHPQPTLAEALISLYDDVDEYTTSNIEPPIKNPFEFDFTKRQVTNLLRPPKLISTKLNIDSTT
ncbi:unnamed protein product [Adineta ricciae]|uniref:Uncharacterized protein n=1 Tax=Adineta ricciae TaxID=249248 RepID=A0A814SZZ6_ADIRI|nr:unnamed protein product [Adineta ricciae]CAF1386519.1 unnamed protein product [Adineta ricciae]